jgi:hypothetical protein
VLQLEVDTFSFFKRLEIDPEQAYTMKVNLSAILSAYEAGSERPDNLLDSTPHDNLPILQCTSLTSF